MLANCPFWMNNLLQLYYNSNLSRQTDAHLCATRWWIFLEMFWSHYQVLLCCNASERLVWMLERGCCVLYCSRQLTFLWLSELWECTSERYRHSWVYRSKPAAPGHRSIEVSMQALDCDSMRVHILLCNVSAYGGGDGKYLNLCIWVGNIELEFCALFHM